MRSFLLVAMVLMTGSLVQAEDWPYFRGPNYNGVSTEKNWQAWSGSSPKVAWRKKVGIGAASFVTAGDRVITMGNHNDRDVVACFENATGKVLWAHEYPAKFEKRMYEGGTAATPTIDVAAGRVYTLGYDGQLHCLDLADGKVVWRTHLIRDFGGRLSEWKYAGSPLVQGDMLIVDTGGGQNSTLALDKKTGKKVWGVGSDNAGYASPIPFEIGGKSGVAVFKGDAMVGHELASGRELWRIPWKTSYDVNASSPTIVGSTLVLSSGYASGRTAAFDLASGQPKKLWQNDDLKTKMSSVVVHDGKVYGITEYQRGSLMCLDLASGKTLWQQPGFGKYGTLMMAGDRLVILSEDGQLVIAAPGETYKELARGKVLGDRCWVMPVLSNGFIYAKNNNGDMVAVDVRGGVK